MGKYTVFPKAPITEALLDIRVELPTEVSLAKLETVHDLVKERFPVKGQRIPFQADIKVSPEGVQIESPPSSGPDGYVFRSPNGGKIVQARLDGFTFNKLKPYEKWEMFRDEAHELWNVYFRTAKPIRITRIALRYINRIEIPLPLKDLKEYILTTPEIAPKLPQALTHFFMRLVIPNPDIDATAIITQTIEPPIANRLPLIFDIDVFREIVYMGNKTEMWDEFEKLRQFKNDIFFDSLTEKAKELFK